MLWTNILTTFVTFAISFYIFYTIFHKVNFVNKFIKKITSNVFVGISAYLFIDIVGNCIIVSFNLSGISDAIANQILLAFVTNIIPFLFKHHIKK
jgi:hypothetical protein